MTAYLPDFRVYTPEDLKDALAARAEGMTPLAGGTDLMVYLEAGVLPPCTFLNLESLPDLAAPPKLNGGLTLSARTTYRDIRAHAGIAKAYPLLPRAAREVGVLAIQSRGTWAGNIANASPAADGVPALMAYDAEVELSRLDGGRIATRRVALANFYKGYKKMDLAPGELITRILLPPPAPGRIEYYRKVGARRLQAITKTLLAGWITLDASRRVTDLRLILGAVAPFTLRAASTEALLRGKPLTPELAEEAARSIQEEISPIDDIRSNAEYRRIVTGNLVREFLNEASRAAPAA